MTSGEMPGSATPGDQWRQQNPYGAPQLPPGRKGPLIAVVVTLVAGLLGVIVLAAVMLTAKPWTRLPALAGQTRPSRTWTDAPIASEAAAPPAAAGQRGVVVTVPQAAQVLRNYWRAHEPALVMRDEDAMAGHDTGPAADWYRGLASCGCVPEAPRTLEAATYLVPRQTGYPAFFLAAATVQSSAATKS